MFLSFSLPFQDQVWPAASWLKPILKTSCRRRTPRLAAETAMRSDRESARSSSSSGQAASPRRSRKSSSLSTDSTSACYVSTLIRMIASGPDGPDCSGSMAFTLTCVCCCCFAGVDLGRDGGPRGPSFTDRRSVSSAQRRRIHCVPLLVVL